MGIRLSRGRQRPRGSAPQGMGHPRGAVLQRETGAAARLDDSRRSILEVLRTRPGRRHTHGGSPALQFLAAVQGSAPRRIREHPRGAALQLGPGAALGCPCVGTQPPRSPQMAGCQSELYCPEATSSLRSRPREVVTKGGESPFGPGRPAGPGDRRHGRGRRISRERPHAREAPRSTPIHPVASPLQNMSVLVLSHPHGWVWGGTCRELQGSVATKPRKHDETTTGEHSNVTSSPLN